MNTWRPLYECLYGPPIPPPSTCCTYGYAREMMEYHHVSAWQCQCGVRWEYATISGWE